MDNDLQYPGRWAIESPDRPAIVMTGSDPVSYTHLTLPTIYSV